MHKCIYIYTHTHMHIYIDIHTYIYIYTYIHTYLHYEWQQPIAVHPTAEDNPHDGDEHKTVKMAGNQPPEKLVVPKLT